MLYSNQRSAKKSTVVSNHLTLMSMRKGSHFISEVFEEESDDEIPIKAAIIKLHPKDYQ